MAWKPLPDDQDTLPTEKATLLPGMVPESDSRPSREVDNRSGFSGQTQVSCVPVRVQPQRKISVEEERDTWSDRRAFIWEEGRRVKASDESGGGEARAKLFLSHCWRDPTTQLKKRRIIEHITRPIKDGGEHGLTFWADYLDLQAQGPVPWRREIEEGIASCCKFVAMVDKAWITSYNCLQELAMAIQHNKPLVILALTQEAWDLMTAPGGAHIVKSEADTQPDGLQSAWEDSQHGLSLCRYEGKHIIAGEPLSLEVVKSLLSHIDGINICPCREVDEEVKGISSVVEMAGSYVAKDLVYHKEHAQLQNKASDWQRAREAGTALPLLQQDEVVQWSQWLRLARQHQLDPQPTAVQESFVAASARSASRRRMMLRVLAILLVLALAGGVVVSTVMAIKAVKAQQLSVAAEARAVLLSREGAASACSGILNRNDYAGLWELKVLHEAIARLPSGDGSLMINNTILTAAHQLASKPFNGERKFLDVHEGGITDVSWSPDGHRLASASQDGTVHVWHDSGPGVTLTQPLDSLQAINWSPDGTQLAVGSASGSVLVWTVPGGEAAEVVELVGAHESNAEGVSWHPSGDLLASASYDGTVKLWGRADAGGFDPDPVLLWEHPPGSALAVRRFECLAFHPSGTLLAAGSQDKKVYIWQIEGGHSNATSASLVEILSAHHTKKLTSLAWSPDGAVLASGSEDFSVALWVFNATAGLSNGNVLGASLPHGGFVRSISWAPGGGKLAVSSSDTLITLWEADLEAGALPSPFRTLQGHFATPNGVSWAKDETKLASGGADKSVRIWGLQDSECLKKTCSLTPLAPRILSWEAHDANRLGLGWAPSGASLAASTLRFVGLWPVTESGEVGEAQGGGPLQVLDGHTSWVASIAWSRDSLVLGSASNDFTIALWAMGTDGLAINSTAPQLVLEGHASRVNHLAWSPASDNRLASCGREGSLIVWRIEGDLSKASADILDGHLYHELFSVAWSPSGNRLASSGADNAIRMWKADPEAPGVWQEVAVLTGHTSAVRSVAWAPGGPWLASGGNDHTVRLWPVSTVTYEWTGDRPLVLWSHLSNVYHVAWSPDSSTLASSSLDTTVRLWRVPGAADDGMPAAPQVLHGHRDDVRIASWTPDGRQLATASFDRTIRVWRHLDIEGWASGLEALELEDWELTDIEKYANAIPSTVFEFEAVQ